MEKIDIDECHQILLDVAKDFHKICVKNGIPYYMLGGTMLGAIRHKGFIPWDDDMDFGIPREYYKTFINIAEQELKPQFLLKSRFNTSYIKLDVLKLEDTRTVIEEKDCDLATEKIEVNIDGSTLFNGQGIK